MGRKKAKYIPAPTGEDLERIENGEKFSDITAGPVKKALSSALNEDVREIEELTRTEEVIEEPKKKKRSLKRLTYFWLGTFVSVMSIIGIIFSVNFVIGKIKNITDNTEQKNKFAKYVYPLVIVDTPTFDDSSRLPVELMLRAGAWDIIINYDEKHSKYTIKDGSITVPESDVEVAATKLFGKGINFIHKDLGDDSLYFNYDKETKSYSLPVSPDILPYRPKVTDINKIDDNKYELIVGYYPPVQDWLPEHKKNIADKFMKYTVVQDGNNYTIVSVKQTEKPTNNSTRK